MIKFTENAPLLSYNTFGMNVHAALLAEYETVDELRQILHDERVILLMNQQREEGKLPFWHIGAGSNLLFRGDYPGVILHCHAKGIDEIVTSDDNLLLKVKPGTIWDEVCDYCAEKGYYGVENLSLIPGETGAAAVQNIGAYGVEIKDVVEQVICFDILEDKERIFSASDMEYGYRISALKREEMKARFIVTDVVIRVSLSQQLHLEYAGLKNALSLTGETVSMPTAAEVRKAVIRIREGKLPDPKITGNAGSFFKNPVVTNDVFNKLLSEYPNMPHYTVDETHTKIPAGWMIEQCGWKGKSLGRAGVYEKQSLVLVNRGGATPDEIITLCQTIVEDVKGKFGICIEPEVNLIG